MRKSWLLCVWLGALACGQNPPSAQPSQAPGNPAAVQAPPAAPDKSASLPPDAAVLTIKGVCPPAKTTTAAKTTSPTTTAAKAPQEPSKPPPPHSKTVIPNATSNR